jgi:predicted DNA-binding protein (MmcQ/YjbR family)
VRHLYIIAAEKRDSKSRTAPEDVKPVIWQPASAGRNLPSAIRGWNTIKDQSKRILQFIKDSYNAEPEFLWSSLPECAALRVPGKKPWFAVIGRVPNAKFCLDEAGDVEVINLKDEPKIVSDKVDGKNAFPAFYQYGETPPPGPGLIVFSRVLIQLLCILVRSVFMLDFDNRPRGR